MSPCIFPDGGADEDIQWLQNCTEPWHLVIEKWQKTSKNRLKEIETSEMTIGAYINKYPVLKTPRGHELLIEDLRRALLEPVHTSINIAASTRRASCDITHI